MGSQINKDNSTEQSNIPKKPKNYDIKALGLSISSIENALNGNSSYNGIVFDKSIINENQKNINYYNSDKVTQEQSISDTNINHSLKLYWEEGGNEVFISGSFFDWNKRIKMYKNKNNIFEQELYLPRGKYYFKFIVDGVWKWSSFYQQEKDNSGNINNYIDTTNINTNKNTSLNKNIIKNNVNNKELNKNIFPKEQNTSIMQGGGFEEMKKKYSNMYPSKEQLNTEAPKVPDVLEILMDLNINTNQKIIGNEYYYDFSIINLDYSFKSILPPFHSYLNHLFTFYNKDLINDNKKREITNYNIKSKNVTYLGINCNIKIKNKYISIVYYSPLNKT